ncbi:MAG: Phosphatidylglycerophosphatase A [Alphaproteobacteria bacterium MarineAlpha5_Bin9]|nr:MAG: Phosphatidylglycerophosphatase A [Alphaproteobacteria bacterium MarineAlpha5_Bin9]|tara:strand:+ start:523 stop:987 length:465 start_codon:yes stop_codon:yes gene_type:complete
MTHLSKFVVTLFYSGFSKYMPGTLSSLISLPIVYFLFINLNQFIFLLLFVLIAIVSFYFIKIYIKDKINKDPKEITIDEFLGIYLIFIFLYNHDLKNIINLGIIFIIFRIFDILKPYPIKIIDSKLKNALGVILDDIFASIYTIITFKLIHAIL